jgi:hypothetical protein
MDSGRRSKAKETLDNAFRQQTTEREKTQWTNLQMTPRKHHITEHQSRTQRNYIEVFTI